MKVFLSRSISHLVIDLIVVSFAYSQDVANVPSAQEIIAEWTKVNDQIRDGRSATITLAQTLIHSETNNPTVSRETTIVKIDEDSFVSELLVHAANDSQSVGQVYGKNPEYLFELGKRGAKSKWRISDLVSVPESETHRLRRVEPAIEGSYCLFPWGLSFLGPFMEDIISGKEQFDKVERVTHNESEYVLAIVTQKSEALVNGQPEPVRRTTKFYLDAKNHLLPSRIVDDFEVSLNDTTFGDYIVLNGTNTPRLVTTVLSPSGGKIEFSLPDLASRRIGAAEFRLPAFGIDEPFFVQKPRPWLVYCAICAFAASVIYWGFRQYLRNKVAT